jgi:hypothetical protein
MAQISYSDDEVEVASQIISSYFEERPEPYAYSNIVENQPSLDIESDVGAFRAELRFADRIGMPIPCVRLGLEGEQLAPVSFELAFGIPPLPSPLSPQIADIEEFRYRMLGEIGTNFITASLSRPQEYIFVDVDSARRSYMSLATAFLATRIASQRHFNALGPGDGMNGDEATMLLPRTFGGHPAPTPGCLFSVSTNSPGLRVHWSGAFRINPNYFSSPTSPVTSVLQSGTFVFGVDGGAYGNSINWDTTAIVSLPGSPQLHLNY